MITLPAHSAHDLDWDIDSNEGGVWHLDFGWDPLDPFDQAVFNANILAVEEFIKRVPDAQKLIFAHLDGNFTKLIRFSEQVEELFQESGLEYALFCAQLTSEYLHRLASILPDAIEPVVLFSLTAEIQFAEMALLLSRRRFEHFQIQFSHFRIPIEGGESIIVSLPEDSRYSVESFTSIFNRLKGRSFKCIPEELLNEHWEGVDDLIIDPESMGEIGRRMLQGFEAAGGHIISTRGPLGFANETSLEQFLSE